MSNRSRQSVQIPDANSATVYGYSTEMKFKSVLKTLTLVWLSIFLSLALLAMSPRNIIGNVAYFQPKPYGGYQFEQQETTSTTSTTTRNSISRSPEIPFTCHQELKSTSASLMWSSCDGRLGNQMGFVALGFQAYLQYGIRVGLNHFQYTELNSTFDLAGCSTSNHTICDLYYKGETIFALNY